METLNKIELNNSELKGLPLFFKKIFYNQVTNAEDELKLYKYHTNLQSIEMRNYDPHRVICKINYPETEENEVFKK
ncbi:hypothetical protein [Sinomicrobium sp. M5D2P9]